jgi:hypothetical protein
LTPPEIRFEQPDRSPLTITSPATKQATDHTALMVMALSLACTALAIFDLLLLATSH